ncbi:hypothetical protein KEJ36_05460 [Candidatus Bathyarchaeota archaeon]|nr:hypothetical protein [Candidatus Bathyarchaeota archaeon]MBS7628227.1 hypothetical protein [Candidatus Bathyarchaeota archaeon]
MRSRESSGDLHEEAEESLENRVIIINMLSAVRKVPLVIDEERATQLRRKPLMYCFRTLRPPIPI